MEIISQQIINKLRNFIVQSEKILILTHYNPDGDAMGSSLALYHYLKKIGKCPVLVTPNDYPKFLHWLPGNDEVLVYKRQNGTVLNAIKEADLIFTLDFNDLDRTEGMEKFILEASAKKIMIDHHPDPGKYADLIISETFYSSTAELVFHILESLGELRIVDATIAECIYTGIMTDTGSFNYNSSRPYTYYAVSKLIEKGVDKDKIYDYIYDNYSEDRMRLLGYCLNQKMEVFPEYNTAFISLTQKELTDFNFVPGDTEGFVNYPLSIKGIKFSAIFIEKENQVKISFRSKGEFATNNFSEQHFNGGGHKNASGGSSKLPLDETLKMFKDLLPLYKNDLNKND